MGFAKIRLFFLLFYFLLLFLPRLQLAPTSADTGTKWELVFPEKHLHLSHPRIPWGPLHPSSQSSSSSSSSLHLSLFSPAWSWSSCISEATDALHRPWKGIRSDHILSLAGNAKASLWMRSAPDGVHGRRCLSHFLRSWQKQPLSWYLIFSRNQNMQVVCWHPRKHLHAPRLRFIWNFSHFHNTDEKNPRQQQLTPFCFKGLFLSSADTFLSMNYQDFYWHCFCNKWL